jgi:hypothetical protein
MLQHNDQRQVKTAKGKERGCVHSSNIEDWTYADFSPPCFADWRWMGGERGDKLGRG